MALGERYFLCGNYVLACDAFEQAVERQEFYEHVTYVSGRRYGTLVSEVDRILGGGSSCVLELETQGARAVKEREPTAVTIFIASPS